VVAVVRLAAQVVLPVLVERAAVALVLYTTYQMV
jgi:hypothetical protein